MQIVDDVPGIRTRVCKMRDTDQGYLHLNLFSDSFNIS